MLTSTSVWIKRLALTNCFILGNLCDSDRDLVKSQQISRLSSFPDANQICLSCGWSESVSKLAFSIATQRTSLINLHLPNGKYVPSSGDFKMSNVIWMIKCARIIFHNHKHLSISCIGRDLINNPAVKHFIVFYFNSNNSHVILMCVL